MPTSTLTLISSYQLARLSFPVSTARRPQRRFISYSRTSMSAPVNATHPEHKYGWALSEKAAGELEDGKVDVWTVFSPASGKLTQLSRD